MQLDLGRITALVEEAKKGSEKRNFKQAVELIMSFKDLDVKSPENRINEIVTLPHGLGKTAKVCVIADGDLVTKAKSAGADLVITKQEIDQYAGNKKAIKKLAESYDYFMARTDLMALVGKTFGSVLGPRGKMPEPLPPTANVDALIKKYRNSVRIRIRDQPAVRCRVGSEDMSSEDLAENVTSVLNTVDRKIKLDQHLSKLAVKTTMGRPAKLR
ncbi:MAG: 50S ribosomal protein L1 [Candidatus Verstraetearchaeota archaeon]|nr:50S ribosomal protein L1 [Candidatus Verstraetearchaeota archaeon]